MTTVLIPIADGSEEIEAATMIDVLRRAEIEVCVANAMGDGKTVTGSRKLVLGVDKPLQDVLDRQWDMIALPGGMPGAQHLSEHPGLVTRLRQQLDAGKWCAAICASPAVVLAQHKLISGANATCYPKFFDQLKENVATVSQEKVVIDGRLITSQGPGTAMVFALTLVETLCGREKAKEVAEALLYDY